MVRQEEVDTLVEILTEAGWLRTAAEPTEQIEWWVRVSLRQRLVRLPLTTGRALMRS